jgi:hypothetical protein
MTQTKHEVFQVNCPGCNLVLWIDSQTREVIKSERVKKKKGSLDDLLIKEKKKKEEVDLRFTSTAELAKKKKQAAREKFEKAFGKLDED